MTCAQYSTEQYSRLADRGEGLVIFADEKHFRVIFSDFGRISCDFRLDIRDFGKKCEIKGNKEKSRESLEATVKGNSHGGLAGMAYISVSVCACMRL